MLLLKIENNSCILTTKYCSLGLKGNTEVTLFNLICWRCWKTAFQTGFPASQRDFWSWPITLQVYFWSQYKECIFRAAILQNKSVFCSIWFCCKLNIFGFRTNICSKILLTNSCIYQEESECRLKWGFISLSVNLFFYIGFKQLSRVKQNYSQNYCACVPFHTEKCIFSIHFGLDMLVEME